MTMRTEPTTGVTERRDRALDAGAETVAALIRLAHVAEMHDPAHPAHVRQIEETQQVIVDYCGRAGRFFSLFFTPEATFVGGELLRGSRVTQEFASDLGKLLEAHGISELIITKDVSVMDLNALAALFARREGAGAIANGRMRARPVDALARLRGLTVERLPTERRITRVYGESVVALRRLFDQLLSGRYQLPPRIKRVAQNLVDLAATGHPLLASVTETRLPNDEAARAVNAAIVAATLARGLGLDNRASVEIVLGALLHDVALPRMRARAVEQTGRSDEDPDNDREVPAGTAATLAAFSGFHESAMPRAVMAFEAQWSRFVTQLGELYGIARANAPATDRAPTMASRLVTLSQRWSRIRMATGSEGRRPPIEESLAELLENMNEPDDIALVRLLVAGLRLYPKGTIVEVDGGETAEVMSQAEIGRLPRLRLTHDEAGTPLARPFEIDLADPSLAPPRRIVRVKNVEAWRGKRPSIPVPRTPALVDEERDSLPSIAPAVFESLAAYSESDDFIKSVRDELAEQLSDVLPSKDATPSQTSEAPAKPSVRPRTPSQANLPAATSSPPSGPSARGVLEKTPLVHVLVHILDEGITGSVELVEPDGTVHLAYFRKGSPVKVKTGRLVSPLGELFAQAGNIETEKISELVEAAASQKLLLGEHLIARGHVTRGQLWAMLEAQLPMKMERLANLPLATSYALYRNVDLLDKWGGPDAVAADPIRVIHSVVRRWHDRDRVRATLAKIVKHPLIVRPDAKIGGLRLSAEERAALDALEKRRATFAVLQHMRLVDAESLNSLLYTLAVTRQLDLPGQRKSSGPMGLRSNSLPPAPQRSVSASRPPTSKPSSKRPDVSPSIADAIASALGSTSSSAVSPSITSAVNPTANVPAITNSPRAASPSSTTLSDVSPSVSPSVSPPASFPSSTGAPPVSSSRERLVEGRIATPAPQPAVQGPPSSSAGVPSSTTATAELDAAERALEAMSRFRRAEEALSRNNYLTAGSLVDEAVELDPEQVDYRATQVWIRAHTSSIEALPSLVGAMTDFLVEAPDHPRVLLYRARLLRKQGRSREAIADYEAHLRVSPKSKEGLAELKALKGT